MKILILFRFFPEFFLLTKKVQEVRFLPLGFFLGGGGPLPPKCFIFKAPSSSYVYIKILFFLLYSSCVVFLHFSCVGRTRTLLYIVLFCLLCCVSKEKLCFSHKAFVEWCHYLHYIQGLLLEGSSSILVRGMFLEMMNLISWKWQTVCHCTLVQLEKQTTIAKQESNRQMHIVVIYKQLIKQWLVECLCNTSMNGMFQCLSNNSLQHQVWVCLRGAAGKTNN